MNSRFSRTFAVIAALNREVTCRSRLMLAAVHQFDLNAVTLKITIYW